MKTALVWFRRDLRLADNPALRAALAAAERVVPVYIHSPVSGGTWPTGGAGRWWLHHGLSALDDSLRKLGSRLVVRRGALFQTLAGLLAETGADAVYWNRLHEPVAIACDGEIERVLRGEGFTVGTHNGALLYEPSAIGREGGEPYRVFTPFWKAVLRKGLDLAPEPAPKALPPVAETLPGLAVAELGLLPRIPWDTGFYQAWRVGEDAARRRLAEFVESGGLARYREERDRPDLPGTSRLSPHLHWGEISPRQVLDLVRKAMVPEAEPGAEAYFRELGWREFAHHLLFHFPETPNEPLDGRFAAFPWARDTGDSLAAWQRGRTGFPLVDAGMRELWRTGWMHNRVRMVAASLLTKNLLIPWREGARWFWDTLVDADLANNTLGWQWTAGCGADAAPYFRVFNPVLQGERFDPGGVYVRRWLPELAALPTDYLHKPWRAPAPVLRSAGVRLGETYPWPLVDLQGSRERALAAFERIKR